MGMSWLIGSKIVMPVHEFTYSDLNSSRASIDRCRFLLG